MLEITLVPPRKETLEFDRYQSFLIGVFVEKLFYKLIIFNVWILGHDYTRKKRKCVRINSGPC